MLHTNALNRRLLIVGTFLSQTPKARASRSVCEDLALQFTEAGWQVITTSASYQRLGRIADMMRTIWQKRANYSVAQVDVYSGLAFMWAEMTTWMLRRLGKPYTLTLHGGNLPEFAKQHPRRVRQLLNHAAAVTTPSHYLLNELKPYRSDLCLLPNPLNLAQYEYRWRQTARPRLIWLRAIHRLYNPALAVHVLAQLRPQYPDIQLRFVGPDKGDGALAEVQNVIQKEGVEESVILVGGVVKADVPYQLNQGDIFLNTTQVDNTPVSVMEAMACGLCVVSTNVGGIPYLLEDGVDALLVPPDDVTQTCDAVQRVLAEPGLAAALSRQARTKAEQWDWSVILPQWEKLLLSIQ